jgi:hypothetical protein
MYIYKRIAVLVAFLPAVAFAQTPNAKTLAQWQIINKCNSIAVQYNANGQLSEVGDVDQLYNLSPADQRASARAVVSKYPDATISVFQDSCQIHVPYKETTIESKAFSK